MNKSDSGVSRRNFLTGAAGVLAAGAAGSAVSAQAAKAADANYKNPYEYNLDHLRKTDPKLLQYKVEYKFKAAVVDPRRLVIGPDDKVYISGNKVVGVFDLQGSKLREFATADVVRALAVDKDGTVYASLKDHVEVFDASGQRKAKWDSPASKTWFTGLAVAENDVFAADAGNRVVLRYDKAGKVIKRIGQKDTAKGIPGFIIPSPFFDVELAADGLLRVTNPGNHQVEAYTFDGDLEFSWGRPTVGIEGFCGCCNPINIALLPDGRVVTCEKGLPRIKVYGAKGQFESVVLGPESFPENAYASGGPKKPDGTLAGLDAAVDSKGRIFVLDQMAEEVLVMGKK